MRPCAADILCTLVPGGTNVFGTYRLAVWDAGRDQRFELDDFRSGELERIERSMENLTAVVDFEKWSHDRSVSGATVRIDEKDFRVVDTVHSDQFPDEDLVRRIDIGDLETQRQRVPDLSSNDVGSLAVGDMHRDVGRPDGCELAFRVLNVTAGIQISISGRCSKKLRLIVRSLFLSPFDLCEVFASHPIDESVREERVIHYQEWTASFSRNRAECRLVGLTVSIKELLSCN